MEKIENIDEIITDYLNCNNIARCDECACNNCEGWEGSYCDLLTELKERIKNTVTSTIDNL